MKRRVEEDPEVRNLKEKVEAKTARLRKEVKALELAPKYVKRFLNIYLRINKLVGQKTIMGCSHERFLKDLMFGARSPKEWDDKSLGWIDMHLREVERTLMRFDRYPDMIGRIRTLEEELKACQNRCRELERGSGLEFIDPIMYTRIEDLDFSTRVRNVLWAADVETLGELAAIEPTQWLKFRNFGRKCLNEIRDTLEAFNLQPGMKVYKKDVE